MKRITVVNCPWPARNGRSGVIVEPPPEQAKVYPFEGLDRNEVVILLDYDPLRPLDDRGWTCVLDRNMIIELREDTP